MAQRWCVVIGVGVLVVATASGATAIPMGKALRPVGPVQDLPELGLSAGIPMDDDGGPAVTATASNLTVRKQVTPMAASSRVPRPRARIGLSSAGRPGGLRVGYGEEAAVNLRADHGQRA